MGYFKDLMIRQDATGYFPNSNKFVCEDCVADSALATVVRAHLEKNSCDFCGTSCSRLIGAPVDRVTEHIAECVNAKYTHAAELPVDSEGDFYVGEAHDLRNLLWNEGYEPANEEWLEAILSAFDGREWCDRDWAALTPVQRRRAGWERFKHAVKHERRYTFWSMQDDGESEFHPDHLPVGEMLAEIGDIIRDGHLIRCSPKGTAYWRVRIHKAGEVLTSEDQLSPPPVEDAIRANRMSPAGVVMFYGAELFETACLETASFSDDSGKYATGARFVAVRDLWLLDLVSLPAIPSFFDLGQTDLRVGLQFLYGFVRDLAEPISRDGREHIDYVPTQAFTEYVRYEMRVGDATRRPDGIRFPSSKDRLPCVVLFCGQAECITPTYGVERWLQFDPASLRTVKVDDLEFRKASVRKGH